MRANSHRDSARRAPGGPDVPDPPDALLEREVALGALRRALASAEEGAGRVALVAGEAGGGKTTLLRAFATGARGSRALWGTCDPLTTPRVLGPIRDLARQIGGRFASLVFARESRDALFTALLDAVEEARQPWILSVEDVHWADEATLDVLTLLGRRIATLPLLLTLSYRDDEVGANPALATLLGALPAAATVRIDLPPLSESAVGELARRAGRDPAGLHALTRGNPFFVQELLRGEGTGIPASVRDAVLGRARRLSLSARAALDLASVVPGSADVDWLRAAGADPVALDECVERGLLCARGKTLEFRHELARRAVEDAVGELRLRGLHARILATRADRYERIGDVALAHLVHHALGAGDDAAILRYALPAAHEAVRAGSHREALRYFEAARARSASLPLHERAELLEGHSTEAYLAARVLEAIESRREALQIWEGLGRAERAGAAHRWLSRLHWWAGQPEQARAEGESAVRVLQPLPPSHELAMAYSNLSQLHMLSERDAPALEWGQRAVDLARTLRDAEALAHALTNVGSVGWRAGEAQGAEQLEEAFATADAAGFVDHAARALVNLAYIAAECREFLLAELHLARAFSYARDHDLGGYARYLIGVRAGVRLERGDWLGAEADAREVVDDPANTGVTGIPALVALGTLQARRGDEPAAETLAEARARAYPTGELQRIGPVVVALAEAAWLGGNAAAVDETTAGGLELASAGANRWWLGELLLLRVRSGLPAPLPATGGGADERERSAAALPEPFRLALAGDWRAAAAAWERRGATYHRAEALAEGDATAAAEALRLFDGMGAARRAALLRRALRQQGHPVPAGPRRSTRANPAGLTRREMQVLELLALGLSNAAIAERLFLSSRTVDHHTSAILRKLGCTSRHQVAAAARAAGLGPFDDAASG